MKIPLVVESTVENNKQILHIWNDGKQLIVDPPFLPYFLTRSPIKFSVTPEKTETITVKPLSTLQPISLIKYSFPTTHHISSINRDLQTTRINETKLSRKFIENHVEFRQRIIIDQPDFFRQHPHKSQLKTFFFDIETATDKGVDLNRIESIAWAGQDRVIYSLTREDEKLMIYALFKAISEENPDIIIGYYMRDFDFIYLFNRCNALGINYQDIARDHSVTYNLPDDRRTVNMRIGGRILYDLLDSVRADQTLYGIKNKKMKTVAKWFGLPIITEDTSSTIHIPTDKLREYNESDVRITYQLFDIYFQNYLTLAEMFGVPLNMILEGEPSFLATIFQGQGLHSKNIVSDGTNKERHPEIFNKTTEDRSSYQAAYVDIFQKGLFKKVYKVDFKGLYNAIEITVNASPDTTKIHGYLPYDPNGFKYKKEGPYIDYYIPDSQINKIVIVRVDNTFDGILRTELKKIREARSLIKRQMKEHESEKSTLQSQQWALKVIANIPSGANGTGFIRFGDIATSILTVGIGRELIKDTLRHVRDVYGDIAIELDTDGIYLSEFVDINYLNSYLEDLVIKMFGVKNELELELEEFAEGYFIKMKHYILYKTNGELVVHGAGLKGSKLPNCFDIALEKLAQVVLKGGDKREIINEVLNINSYDTKDLVLSFTLSKLPESYSPTSFWGKLIRQAKTINLPVSPGTQLEYVKCTNEHRLFPLLTSRREIDNNYYKSTISKLITNLGLEDELKSRNTQNLDNWL